MRGKLQNCKPIPLDVKQTGNEIYCSDTVRAVSLVIVVSNTIATSRVL